MPGQYTRPTAAGEETATGATHVALGVPVADCGSERMPRSCASFESGARQVGQWGPFRESPSGANRRQNSGWQGVSRTDECRLSRQLVRTWPESEGALVLAVVLPAADRMQRAEGSRDVAGRPSCSSS